MEKCDKKIILAVASEGGHLVQLKKIIGPLTGVTEFVIISTGSNENDVDDFSRRNPLKILKVALQFFHLFKKYKPTHLITTGAAPGLIAVFIARLKGVKSLWIDSAANANDLSGSGKIALRLADKTVSQWKTVADRYKNVDFVGNSLTKTK